MWSPIAEHKRCAQTCERVGFGHADLDSAGYHCGLSFRIDRRHTKTECFRLSEKSCQAQLSLNFTHSTSIELTSSGSVSMGLPCRALAYMTDYHGRTAMPTYVRYAGVSSPVTRSSRALWLHVASLYFAPTSSIHPQSLSKRPIECLPPSTHMRRIVSFLSFLSSLLSPTHPH